MMIFMSKEWTITIRYNKEYDNAIINIIDERGYQWNIERIPFAVVDKLYSMLDKFIGAFARREFQRGANIDDWRELKGKKSEKIRISPAQWDREKEFAWNIVITDKTDETQWEYADTVVAPILTDTDKVLDKAKDYVLEQVAENPEGKYKELVLGNAYLSIIDDLRRIIKEYDLIEEYGFYDLIERGKKVGQYQKGGLADS